MQPRPCTSPEQAPMALERWTTSLQAYLDAGGEKLDDERKKPSILKISHWKIQERVLWDFDGFKSCEQLISWIKAKVRITSSWKPGGAEAHMIDDLDEQGQRELEALGRDAVQEEINALLRRGQARFAQKRWPQRKVGAGDGGADGGRYCSRG